MPRQPEKPASVPKTRKTPASPTSSIAKDATHTDPHAAAAVARDLRISCPPRDLIPIMGIALADVTATPHASAVSLKLSKSRSLDDSYLTAPSGAHSGASQRKFPALLRFRIGAKSRTKYTFLIDSAAPTENDVTPSKQTAK